MRLGNNDVTEVLFHSLYDTEEGTGSVIASTSGLLEVTLPIRILRDELESYILNRSPGIHGDSPLTLKAAALLQRYFHGERVSFNLPIDERGFTPFQSLVYRHVREIVHGVTKSYGEIALKMGRPKAARGVGAALAKNPLPIIIPCHRVVGSTGKMTGFSAPGGVERKASLLRRERCET